MCASVAGLHGPATAAPAFECPPLQPSATQRPAYQRSSVGALCEGFFEQNVSHPFIELLSLTRDPPAPQLDSAPLEIRAEADARLLVQPLSSGVFYRVDASLTRAQSLRWDPSRMLEATQLPLREFGFVAVAASSTPQTLQVVPISLRAGAGGPAKLHALLRVSVDVASMSWRAYRLGAAAPAAWQPLADAPLYAWQVVALPLGAVADEAGLRVDVQAVDESGQRLPLLRFMLVGP